MTGSISKMQKIFGLGTDYDNNYDISLIADLLQMNIINWCVMEVRLIMRKGNLVVYVLSKIKN